MIGNQKGAEELLYPIIMIGVVGWLRKQNKAYKCQAYSQLHPL